jgi:hypothetical protein
MGEISFFEGMNIETQAADLDIPLQFRDDGNAGPWAPMNLQADNNFWFLGMDNITAQNMSPSPPSSHQSTRMSSHHSSPSIPSAVKPRHVTAKGMDPIKKVRGSGRVEKKKSAAAPPLDNFVVVTPNTINQQSGKPNPYECFEVIRGNQRGRKGPLANKAAESALNIRRMGACFCCRRYVFLLTRPRSTSRFALHCELTPVASSKP